MNANEVIEKFGLVPLPEEGGFYKETYRDPRSCEVEGQGTRAHSTCIYYLVTPEEFSALHIVKSTEIFHFYAGDPVHMIQITESGELTEVIIGNDLTKDQSPQVIVPPNIWQGTRVAPGGEWALIGCTVAPGFEFEDFGVESRAELTARFPAHADLVSLFTR